MIIDELKLFFVHLPKTGGTSIENTLLEYLGYPDMAGLGLREQREFNIGTQHILQHEPLTSLLAHRSDLSAFRGFTVVRDPKGRSLSEYGHQQAYRNRGLVDPDTGIHLTYQDAVESGVLFSNASRYHNWPQCRFLVGYRDLDIRVLRYERLDEDWAALTRDLLGEEVALRHDNRSRNRPSDTSLTDRGADMLDRWWGVDRKVFGYA